jgi:molecular chaperone HscA
LQAIDLMRRAAEHRDEFVTGIAVTCRCPLHSDAIRAAAGSSRLTIVDEPLAQLHYLRFTGQLPDEGAVLLYDLGASGLTLTEANCDNDTILGAKRSTVLGGDSHDALVRWRLAHGGVAVDQPTSRAYKESLTSTPVLTVGDPRTGTRMVLTRSDFNELVLAGIHHSVSYVRQLVDETGVSPRAVVLLGGCARSSGVRESLAQLLDLPLIYDAEPELVSARGAVLMATPLPSARRGRGVRLAKMPKLGPAKATSVSRRKVVAALAVTASLGATVAGLLVADQNSQTAGTPVTPAPTPMEIAGTPANQEPPK